MSKNILVVDDTAANLSVLTTILTKEGYQVRPAISGKIALSSIELQIPDLILLDIRMPEMDGFEVCRRLKANDETAAIPVIFISALNEINDKVAGFEVGGVDYITKPFQHEEVIIRVKNHLTIADQRKKIEELVLVQNQMIDMVTHNLKNPLSRILLYVDMIENTPPDKTLSYLDRIRSASQHINSLIEDFLDIRRIESGVQPEIQSVPMMSFIQVMIDRFTFLAKEKNISLEAFIPDKSLQFNTDPHYLDEAISNLISNAIKYSPNNSKVIVSAQQKDDSIIIEVKDNGEGIDPKYLPHIFDKFYRIPNHKRSSIPGTGLGLAITKSIIERLGGEIFVESKLDGGTQFEVVFPRLVTQCT